MDTIDDTLTSQIYEANHHPAIHAGLSLGKQTLNQCYGKTDESEVYCIAVCKCTAHPLYSLFTANLMSTVLHPQYKQKYMKRQNWPDEWIDTAIDTAKSVFKNEYGQRGDRH
jgi:hypothetical protein